MLINDENLANQVSDNKFKEIVKSIPKQETLLDFSAPESVINFSLHLVNSDICQRLHLQHLISKGGEYKAAN